MSSPKQHRPLKIAFLHPDLGIGGAERLVVDVALSLKKKGHDVTFYTSHHDPSHCFQETVDGTLTVKVYGDFLPTNIGHKFHVICAYLRNLYAACALLMQSEKYDVVFVDQISASVPLLKFKNWKVLFYCHFPDMLLVQNTSLIKKLYRIPVDFVEQITTGLSDRILVNSEFTGRVFSDTFRLLNWCGVSPSVLYPSINFVSYDCDEKDLKSESGEETALFAKFGREFSAFVSINRFERKKNILLAIQAFHQLRKSASQSEKKEIDRIKLIVAGGYDERVRENCEYYVELKNAAEELGLTTCDWPAHHAQVILLRSFNNQQRGVLLTRALAIIYTPQNEHFGIVPLEAMYARRPVIACNSGGPLETVGSDESRGFLCAPNADQFAAAMKKLVVRPELVVRLGESGRAHVLANFSYDAFTNHLNECVYDLSGRPPRKGGRWRGGWIGSLLSVFIALIVFVATQLRKCF